MNTTLIHRILIFLSLTCLAACSTLPAEDRVNRTVERVREAAATGFIDVTIDYAEPNLYISGHSYFSADVSRLMRSIVIDKSSDLKLVEIKQQNIEGLSIVAFRLIESDIGSLRKWSGPITLEFPRPTSSDQISLNRLHAYSLNDLVFLAVIGAGQQKRAVIRSPDGALYRVKEGNSIGKERALINEINEKSLILLESAGTKRELKIVQPFLFTTSGSVQIPNQRFSTETATCSKNTSVTCLDYTERIRLKILKFIAIPSSTPPDAEVVFDLFLLPDGKISSVKQIKSSGFVPYEQAVARALVLAEPLPVPEDSETFKKYRYLRLTFRPQP